MNCVASFVDTKASHHNVMLLSLELKDLLFKTQNIHLFVLIGSRTCLFQVFKVHLLFKFYSIEIFVHISLTVNRSNQYNKCCAYLLGIHFELR